MGTNEKTVNHSDKPAVPEQPQRPKVCGFTTPWLKGNLGFFCIHLAVIGPVSEEPEGNLALTSGETEAMLKEISYLVKSLKQELRGKHPPR